MKKPRKQSPRQVTDEAAVTAFAPIVKALVNQPLRARQPADPPGFVRDARVRKP